MSLDRTVRRLTALQESASTARVLNLAGAHKRLADSPEQLLPPLFELAPLNRSIIVKHRLRDNEYDIFTNQRRNATKVMLPIDIRDLRLGAHYIFLRQRDFDRIARDVFGDALEMGRRDRQILELIDDLPSLDPFLLREHLKRHGFSAARAYFNISDADIERMHAHVQAEITPLAMMAFKGEPGSQAAASKLVSKILASNAINELGPLKSVFRLDPKEFLDGIFAWRGFLYYKWALQGLEGRLGEVLHALAAIQPRGPRDPEATAYIGPARQRIVEAAQRTISSIGRMMEVYDTAYLNLVNANDPAPFREFLLKAPAMFLSLGEQLGALQHIESFWNHRFPPKRPALISVDELMEFMLDFEDSLAVSETET